MRPGNSHDSFQKRFAPVSDRYGKVLHQGGEDLATTWPPASGKTICRANAKAIILTGFFRIQSSDGTGRNQAVPQSLP